MSEKLFEAIWLDINAAKQKKGGKGRAERKGRKGKRRKGNRKESQKEGEERNDSDLVRHCAKLVGNATLP